MSYGRTYHINREQDRENHRERLKSRSRSSERRRLGGDNSRCSSSPFELNLRSPILGKYFSVPDLYRELAEIELDDSQPHVPVYTHFIVPEIQPVVRPKTPPVLKALRAEFAELQLPSKITKNKSEQLLRSRNSNHSHCPSNKSLY
ncbi:hypothetical protein QAD02_017038 [Eretmocerus hayati]|uniref:Uncharacterized protein n=1 Tax=Eretmocerus hayati TaxID=131215 RepID=A0ACC2PEN0_9HYME|nr:hypothetical protein QAD02_017038 [Eretmocerus hayati]